MNPVDIVSWLAVQLKPRYHVSGLEGMYFERQPYRIVSEDSPIQAVTRFIALARVGNPQKEKWIYALNLTPIDKMKMADILQKTTDETDCPYNVAELSNTSKFFFFLFDLRLILFFKLHFFCKFTKRKRNKNKFFFHFYLKSVSLKRVIV